MIPTVQAQAEVISTFLSERGLNPECQTKIGCRWAARSEVAEVSGFDPEILPETGAITIPYPGVTTHDGQQYCRYRNVGPVNPTAKWPKYLGPKGHRSEIYFPPDYQTHKNQPVLHVVEGEIKAALLDSIGLRALAIPGVYSWAEAGHREMEKAQGIEMSGQTKPHASLLAEAISAKQVIVVGDSDLAFNPQAKHGMRCLTQALSKYISEHREAQAAEPGWNPIRDARHTVVSLAIVPPQFMAEPTGEKDKNDKEITTLRIGKLGVDDYFKLQITNLGKQNQTNVADSEIRLKAGQRVRTMLEALALADLSVDDVGLGKLIAVENQERLAAREKEWLFFTKQTGVWTVAKGFEYLQAPASIIDRIDAAYSKIDMLYGQALGIYKNQTQAERPNEINEWWAEYKHGVETLRSAKKRLRSTKQQMLILPQVARCAQIAKPFWDRHNELFACANGVINLKTGDFLPHDPALLQTMRSEVIYDPLAECPKWMEFLAQVQPEAEVQKYIQTLFGYAATGDIKGHIIPFFVGRGGNGKGVLINVLRKVFGGYQTVAPKSLVIKQKNSDPHPADLDSVRQVRWATLSEFSEDTHFDCGKLKNITGGDNLTARGMHQNFSTFDPHVVFTADTNDIPQITEPTESMKRRILIIEWPISFKGREDRNLEHKLLEELPGILNWLVQGAMAYYRGDLNAVPQSVIKATDALWESVDSVGQWIEAECVKDTSARTDCKILGESYARWCRENRIPECGNRKFNSRLRSSGIETNKSNGRCFASGLRVRTHLEQSFTGCEHQNATPHETPPPKKPPVSVEAPQPAAKKMRRIIQ